jgi:hypothetical protein
VQSASQERYRLLSISSAVRRRGWQFRLSEIKMAVENQEFHPQTATQQRSNSRGLFLTEWNRQPDLPHRERPRWFGFGREHCGSTMDGEVSRIPSEAFSRPGASISKTIANGRWRNVSYSLPRCRDAAMPRCMSFFLSEQAVREEPEEPESSAGTHQLISGPAGRMPHTCCDDRPRRECWSLPLAKTPRAAAQASVTSGVLNLTPCTSTVG